MKPENVKAWAISIGALLAVIAASGPEALTVIGGLPALIRAYADGLPGGLWSFLLASCIAGGLHFWVRTWSGKSLTMELATIMAGIGVCNLLAWRSGAAQHVSAALVGLLAGMVGLFVSKAAYGWRFRRAAKRDGCPPGAGPTDPDEGRA